MSKRTRGAFAIALALLVPAAVAEAHQTATSKGVTVTLHVVPDDEPSAGQPSTITVTRVRVRRGAFRWSSCGCRLRVSSSAGRVVLDQRVRNRSTRFTFPSAGAYRITFSGRVRGRDGGRSRSFSTAFAIRAG